MKKLFIILFLLPLLGLGCQKLGGGTVVKNTLDAEQIEWIKTHDTYKIVKPFVASDGKTYRVDSIVEWRGKGIEPIKSYKIEEIIPESVTTTI